MGYDIDFFKNGGSNIPCICDICDKPFFHRRNVVLKAIQEGRSYVFCSRLCVNNFRYKDSSSIVKCNSCGVFFSKLNNQIRRSVNQFCSRSCAGTYNNAHKIKGTRRSKLEVWLEKQLKELYPTLEVLYSDKTTINSELDIYIPSLKLAFELNGVFHYEAIFGEDKLEQIRNNDDRKFQACLEKGIELCIIDTSNQKYFKEYSSQKYLDIITTIINNK